mmetsp:Transcript_60998/g.145348  ORF Transcript_60998/g.145348 Transcript_60998/m.145348 type:complete len:314 (+) Transcript_60998:65-1006(+)
MCTSSSAAAALQARCIWPPLRILALCCCIFGTHGCSSAGSSLLSVRSDVVVGSQDAHQHSSAEVPERVSRLLCPYAAQQGPRLQESAKHRMVKLLDQARKAQGSDSSTQALTDRLDSAKRCAVVSNSGVLLQHQHGQDIDSADLVFRFNDAEIGGNVSASVGVRDDVRILNFESSQVKENWAPKAAGTTIFVSKEMNVMSRPRSVGWQMITEHCGARKEHANEFLTTGYQGVVLAMFLCEEVHAYGFAATDASKSAPYHYYGHLLDTSTGEKHDPAHLHVTEPEKRFYSMVATNADYTSSDVVVIPGFSSLRC